MNPHVSEAKNQHFTTQKNIIYLDLTDITLKYSKTYKHLFFDLDHTLWDYERNSAEALLEIFQDLDLQQLGIASAEVFIENFNAVNQRIWHLYDHNQITQEELRHYRFRWIFDALGINDYSHCDDLNAAYLQLSPQKPHLIPFAKEVLEYLHPKYPLHLITNGFDEIQGTKLKSAGITHYFQEVITSQRAGAKKPSPHIFQFAIDLLDTRKEDCIMIGDNPDTDIKGALAAGVDVVYFNPFETPIAIVPYRNISSLHELLTFL